MRKLKHFILLVGHIFRAFVTVARPRRALIARLHVYMIPNAVRSIFLADYFAVRRDAVCGQFLTQMSVCQRVSQCRTPIAIVQRGLFWRLWFAI